MSVPLKTLFCCDKQCSEKTFSCWQLASVVLNEGGEAYTTNRPQKCFNKHLQAKGEEPLSNCALETGRRNEGVSWKNEENDGERTTSAWDAEYFLQERRRVKRYRELADEEKQAGKTSGSRNRQQKNTWNK